MQNIDDVDRYLNECVPEMLPFVQKYGGEILVGGPGAEPAEGDPPNSAIVIRFADTDTVWALLNDPDYQRVKEIRLSATSRGQMVVAPEFAPRG